MVWVDTYFTQMIVMINMLPSLVDPLISPNFVGQLYVHGISYSCMYLQSLLRDSFFTVRTDHRNLLFITEASNPMIVGWYMALSEFSFTLEFIPGVDNDIADSLSRLCRNDMIDSPREFCPECNISYWHYLLSLVYPLQFNIQRLICCTSQLLATVDLNVLLNVSRI